MKTTSTASLRALISPAWRSACALMLLACAATASAQIVQPTFTAGQINTIVTTFNQTNAGDRVTIADYQHGQLYMAAGSAGTNVRDSWWNINNPLSPVLVQSIVGNHDKPHNIAFWKTYFTEANNGTTLRIWDYTTRTQVGTRNGTVNSLWDFVQAPYAYTGSHGYTTGSKIEIWNVDNPSNIISLGAVDTGTTPGFQIGAVNALGNILTGSGTEAPGIAVYDISDPANPLLLDSRVDGTNMNYTALIYGSRVYNCERAGIRVYDFSNPNNIQLVGSVATGGQPRYLVFKDGKGYCAPGNNTIKVFDATTLTVTQTIIPDGKVMDFVYPLGNMLLVAGGGSGNATNGARFMALQQAPDTTGPAVVYGLPTNNAVNIGLKSRIGFSMSDQIDVNSLTTNTFIVRPVGTTTPIPGTYSTMMGLINFSPLNPLVGGVTYEVILTAGGVKDVVGNGIAAQHRITFTTVQPVITSDGLNHRWPMDGNLLDVVGVNSGANNGVTFTNGFNGQAGAFNGTSHANLGAINFSNNFTISAWVWVNTGTTNIQTIMANSSGGLSNGFRLFVNTYNTADRSVMLETANGTVMDSARTGGGVVTLGAWNHIAATVNRTSGTAAIYVNGTNFTTDGTIRTDFSMNAVTHMGQFTNNSFRLSGRLDEVRTYNRVLTSAEIGTLNIMTHHWPMDGDFVDYVGSNNGLNFGAGLTNAARIGTQAGVFDGADYVDVGALNLGNNFSIATWVRLDVGATNIQTLVANSAGGASTDGFRLYVNTFNTSDGAVVLETGNGTANNNARTSTGVVGTNGWAHVTLTMNRSSGTAVIYVNGVNVTTDGSVVTNFTNSSAIHLGQMASAGFRLRGRLDDVRIYNKVLSQTEVTTLLTASGNTPPVITSLVSSASKSLVNANVTFTINATDANNDGLSYSFDFGTGAGQQPFTLNKSASFTYTNAGRYTVFGRARDASGTVTTSMVQVVHYTLTATNAVASSQIIYDNSRTKVWNVNPDSDTVTRIDGNSLAKDFEIAVGKKPRSLALRPDNSEVWVTCESSDEIYVLNANTGALVQTIDTPRGSRPMGVAFQPNGAAAYVTYMNTGLLAKWNPSTKALVGTLNVGQQPRAISISGDSTRIFVGRFISPVNPFNPGAEVGEVREVGVASFTVTRTFTLAHSTTPDTESSSRGTPNYLTQMAISPDGRRLFVPSKKDNVDRGTWRDGNALTHDRSVRAIVSQLDLINNNEALASRVDIDNRSFPHGVVFSPVGDLAFVAMQGNNEVLILNAYTGVAVSGFKLGNELSPQDLVMKPDGSRLYVMNFMTRSVSAYNISSIVAGTSSEATPLGVTNVVATEKLSATVLKGKQIFYNAADERMSAEGYMSCASCHLDGGSDRRVWDFTDRGEGLRMTTGLEGRRGMGHGRVHWSGNFDEIQDFELDIRNAFNGTGFITNGVPNSSLGAANAGRSADLDALAAYVASLTKFNRSPFRNADGTLTSDAVAGKAIFTQLNCASCHSGADFTDSTGNVLRNVGTIKASSGQRLGAALTGLDTPTLKGLWDKGPYLHDGSATNLIDVITTQNPSNQHGVTSGLTTTQRNQLVAYLQQIDDLEVGGMTHLWPFQNNVNDVVGTNNGTNNIIGYTSGQVGQAAQLNGTNFVGVGQMNLGSNFTIASWVYIDPAATNIQTIMANSGGGSSTDGFRLFVNTWNTSDGAVNFETGDGTAGNGAKSSTAKVMPSAWNFVAVTVNRTAGTAAIYVNGTNYTADGSITTNFNVTNAVFIGQMGNAGGNRLRGMLDEVAIFNRSLTTNEMSILMSGDNSQFLMSMMGGGGGGGSSMMLMQMPSGGAKESARSTSSGGALPPPWLAQDIGAVAVVGSESHDNGSYTISGSGSGIWNTKDEFRYVYQTATGDCDIRARLNGVDGDVLARAGVMIRETLNPNSAHASMLITGKRQALFERRLGTGGTTSVASVTVPEGDVWVRVQRSGQKFTTMVSSDGVKWVVIGSVQMSMSQNVYIGLGVSSHVDGIISTTTLDDVTAVP
ncbi:MAG TPA: LamG-like jellyroll fold domain-containing protein [Verrucomicrobiae bacterium]